jgi:hypothetical protein
MPSRTHRNFTRRQSLDESAISCLAGEKRNDFFRFKPVAELEALFEEYDNHNAMFYRRGMLRPITLETLEAFGDAWLNSGDDDEYGAASYFIDAHYTPTEKAALFKE